MRRDVRPEITQKTNDPEHTGVARRRLDDRIFYLDAAGAETGIRQEIDNRPARRHIQAVRSGCSRSWPWRTRLRRDVWGRP
jgi:hypothetical protein